MRRQSVVNTSVDCQEASRGFEPLNEGFADPCLTTWPRRQILNCRAGDGIRTHDLLLGKETYYHCTTPAFLVSVSDRECRDPGSNWGHRDFQSRALPTELSRPDLYLLSVRDFTRGYRDCQARDTHTPITWHHTAYHIALAPEGPCRDPIERRSAPALLRRKDRCATTVSPNMANSLLT